MNLEEILDEILASQLANELDTIAEGKKKVASLIVPGTRFDAIKLTLEKFKIYHHIEDLEGGYKLILLAKERALFSFISEVTETSISKDLKAYFINTII